MATFLIASDYNAHVRKDLFTLLTDTPAVRGMAEREAEAEVSSYLGGRYDLGKLYKKNTVWNPATEYTFNQLVVIQAADYNATMAYVVDNLVAYTDGNVYIATATTTPGEDPLGNPGKWSLVGVVDSFYTALKTDDFVLGTSYTIGQFVVYNGVRYEATANTTGTQLPTDTDFWVVNTDTVTAGTLPSVTASWTEGDTRNPLIIMHTVNVATWILSAQANPRNIRQDYRDRRDDTVNWLKMAADPRKNITPDFPEVKQADKQGFDVVWNSNPKVNHGQNSY